MIEVDGSQHAQPDAMEYDRIRTMTLESIELVVLRFTNAEVEKDFAQVCGMIEKAVQERAN